MKIKIVKQEKEIEGEIIEGRVTPFGTSAHIPFRKEHLGKAVPIIIPTDPKYIWLLKELERKKIINSAKKIIKEENGKLEHHRLNLLKDLSKSKFNLDSLIKVISILDNQGKERLIVAKIKGLYNFV